MQFMISILFRARKHMGPNRSMQVTKASITTTNNHKHEDYRMPSKLKFLNLKNSECINYYWYLAEPKNQYCHELQMKTSNAMLLKEN